MDLGIVNHGLETTVCLQGFADALGVFFQLGRVKRLGKNIFQERWTGERRMVSGSSWRPQRAALYVLVAHKLDLADLDLGPFLHVKRDGN